MAAEALRMQWRSKLRALSLLAFQAEEVSGLRRQRARSMQNVAIVSECRALQGIHNE